ncbi:hypothetical protein BASA81_008605 [Batrachochytrium salamandrivorans]|nr:hypothetical protein BASA81_008605 [Batrachochytrium salamandrivorans]
MGRLSRFISDRGKSFLAEGISEFERENSIRHLATTPYHPQTNGMVERMHAMLGHGLTTLVADKRDRWDEYLPQVLLGIRTRTHAVTGYSPFYLLFGTHPRLPNDETPPRSSLCLWTKLKGMEEKLGIYCQELRRSWPGTISSKCQDQRLKPKQCENETDFDEKHSGLLLQGWRYGEDETPRSTEIRVQLEGSLPCCRCWPSRNLLDYDSRRVFDFQTL